MKLGDIKERLGPLWWYTLLIFCAQRLTDLLNAVAGLWLIPQYVPQAELGAVQPLTQIGAMLGLPIAILVTPFIKMLNTHAALKEYGKVKALLRDATLISATVFIVTLASARLLMPSVFRYLRVENGRLATLIVIASIIGALAPVFTGALQALKRFSVYSVISLCGAPIRFFTLLVALPIRGLTGYFVGQTTGPVLTIGVAVVDFLRTYGRKVKCEPYWKEDRVLFFAFLVPIVIMGITGNAKGTAEMLLLRGLPDVESAAFYHLSRFSEIATYLVTPLLFVMFPTIAEKHELGGKTHRILLQTMFFSLVTGIGLSVFLTAYGAKIFALADVWAPYREFTGLFWVMTMTASIRMACSCFTLHEMACRRFSFAYYFVPINIVEAILIYTIIRYPNIANTPNWNLSDVLHLMLLFPTLMLIGVLTQLFVLSQSKRNPSGAII